MFQNSFPDSMFNRKFIMLLRRYDPNCMDLHLQSLY